MSAPPSLSVGSPADTVGGRVVRLPDHDPLDTRRSVAVDTTQPARADRAGVIAVARARGARVVGYWFPPDLPLCRARNAGRASPVPEVGLHTAAARWEEPALAAGFDALIRLDPRTGRIS